MTRRSLLASLMALSLLCGGLGVAEASVHVNENTGGAYEVLTKQEVTDELNKKVSTEVADLKYAKAFDVFTKTDANEKFATKDALNDLEDVVNNKVDESAFETALEGKADATALDDKADKTTVDALDGRVGNVEGKVTALETTVGDASSGLVKDVNDLRNQGNTLNSALGNKADKTELDAAKEKISTIETNITALQKNTT